MFTFLLKKKSKSIFSNIQLILKNYDIMSITRSHDQDWHFRNARFVQPVVLTSRLIKRKDYQNNLKCVPHVWRLSPRQWPMFDSSLWPFAACHPVSLSLSLSLLPFLV